MRNLLFILPFLVLLIGCTNGNNTSGNNTSEYPLLPYPHVIVWDNKAYVILENETLSIEDIGEQIGEVKRYIDPNEKSPEEDEDSTFAPVGSKIFALKNESIKTSIAVEMNGKFLKAIHTEP